MCLCTTSVFKLEKLHYVEYVTIRPIAMPMMEHDHLLHDQLKFEDCSAVRLLMMADAGPVEIALRALFAVLVEAEHEGCWGRRE